MLNKLRWHAQFWLSANRVHWSRLLIWIHILNGKQCRSRSVGLIRSQLIWIYTVCKGSVYPGSAGLWLTMAIIVLASCLVLYAASQTTVLHIKRLGQTKSQIFVILCVLCFQRHTAAVKSLPLHHHIAGYILFPFGIIEPILVILKIEYRLSRRYGAYAASQTSVAYEEAQSNRVSVFRDFVCSLFLKAIFFYFYFTLL